jgi:hypothetical protein
MPEWLDKKKREWAMLKAFWPERSWAWRMRNIFNFIDDPVDDLKHKLHGIEFAGRKYYLPKWLMSSGKPKE